METVRTRNARPDAYGFDVDCQGSSPYSIPCYPRIPVLCVIFKPSDPIREPLNSTDESDITNHPPTGSFPSLKLSPLYLGSGFGHVPYSKFERNYPTPPSVCVRKENSNERANETALFVHKHG